MFLSLFSASAQYHFILLKLGTISIAEAVQIHSSMNLIFTKFNVVEMSVLPLNYFADFISKRFNRRTDTTALHFVKIMFIEKLISSF